MKDDKPSPLKHAKATMDAARRNYARAESDALKASRYRDECGERFIAAKKAYERLRYAQ